MPRITEELFVENESVFFDHIQLAQRKHLKLYDGQNTGNIQRCIELRSVYDVDRPWISWIDENARHRVAMGYHTRLIDALGGDTLIQYEIKTIASSTGPDPTDMRTRFTVGTDAQRVKVGVVYADTFEFYQGENPVALGEGVKAFSIDYRAVAQDTFSSANFKLAQLQGQLDANDNTNFFLDINPPYTSGGSLFPGNKTATLTFFRNTTVVASAGPQFKIKKGDNTNTDAFVFSAGTGKLELPLALASATGIVLGNDSVATLYRSAASTVKTDASLLVAGSVGFNGTTPVSKPTVSGSRGANAALASLLTALANTGILTDSTTA